MEVSGVDGDVDTGQVQVSQVGDERVENVLRHVSDRIEAQVKVREPVQVGKSPVHQRDDVVMGDVEEHEIGQLLELCPRRSHLHISARNQATDYNQDIASGGGMAVRTKIKAARYTQPTYDNKSSMLQVLFYVI